MLWNILIGIGHFHPYPSGLLQWWWWVGHLKYRTSASEATLMNNSKQVAKIHWQLLNSVGPNVCEHNFWLGLARFTEF